MTVAYYINVVVTYYIMLQSTIFRAPAAEARAMRWQSRTA